MAALDLEVVVLAGGQGTRLRSVTGDLPKALVPVGGRPFIDWKLAELAAGGATHVHLLLGHRAEVIERYLKERPTPIPVTVFRDGEKPLGTLGAVVARLSDLPERFVVTYGDALLDESVSTFWSRFLGSGYPAMMAVTRQLDSERSGNCRVGAGRVLRYAKGVVDGELEWLDYGLLGIEKVVLEGYTPGEVVDLGRAISGMAAEGRLAAFEVSGRFWEVGTPDSHAEVDAHLKTRGRGRISRPLA